MATFRNDFDDPPEQYVGDDGQLAERPGVRVLPTLGYLGVRKGDEFEVPDDAWEHYAAGGFTPLTPDPRLKPAPAPTQAAAAAQPQQQEAAVAAGGSEAA